MNTKSNFIILFFRFSGFFSRNYFLKLIGFPVRLLYKIIVRNLLAVDLPDSTKVGKNFEIFHGFGIVIHSDVVIGDNVSIRHCTTIGDSDGNGNIPKIGNNVNIGSNTVIIGNIIIGSDVIIGAGSVVVDDISDGDIIVGNPAKSIL